jgi:anaerobic selenocysteine-containing dehydrogenase
MAVKEVKTYCRICISNCGLIADVDGDQVLDVRGDRDHPFTRGYSCSKGRSLHLMHHHPNRIERPQMRVNGELVDTNWETALDDLGAKLRKIIAESGPRAVAIFTGGGGYLDGAAYLSIRSFISKLGSPSIYSDLTIDSAPKFWVSDLISGITGQSPRPDFEKTKLTIFIGSNPMVSHGHTFMLNVPSDRLRQLKANGEIWVLDPRRTDTATRATRHLQPRPGTDYAIMAFLVREILCEGADREYLAKHAQDVDRLTATVEPFTVAKASMISGVAQSDLTDMLAAVRRAGRLAVENGTGVNMSREGNLVAWLSWALMIVTGSLDREGGAWINPGLLMQVDRLDLPPSPPGGVVGPGPESRPELRSLRGEYPCVALPDEIAAGHVRALISFGGNVVAALPGTESLVAGLKKLEAVATFEIIRNNTTANSTHVFPYLATQYTGPTVSTVGDRKSFWWIASQLGKRLDMDVMPGLDIDTATDDEVLATITQGTRVTFDQLKNGAFYIHDEKPQIGWLQKYVDEKLGGWRVAPQDLVDQLKTMTPPGDLVLISHRQKKHMNARFIDRETIKNILIGPEEAAKAGLKDGDRAIVQSDYGKLEGVVKIDNNLPKGVLNVPHGWDDSFNVNLLTSTKDCDPFTGMAWMSGFTVTIRPAWQINAPHPERNIAAAE